MNTINSTKDNSVFDIPNHKSNVVATEIENEMETRSTTATTDQHMEDPHLIPLPDDQQFLNKDGVDKILIILFQAPLTTRLTKMC